MSVQQNHYAIFGYSLPWVNTDHLSEINHDNSNTLSEVFQKYSDSAFNPAKKNSFIILDDGMNGNHLLIGICLASTQNYEGFEDIIDCSISLKHKNLLKQSIQDLIKQLPNYYDLESQIKNLKPKVYLVTQYR